MYVSVQNIDMHTLCCDLQYIALIIVLYLPSSQSPWSLPTWERYSNVTVRCCKQKISIWRLAEEPKERMQHPIPPPNPTPTPITIFTIKKKNQTPNLPSKDKHASLSHYDFDVQGLLRSNKGQIVMGWMIYSFFLTLWW